MNRQKVILFGAGGRTGNDLITESLKRKHRVTAIVYDVSRVTIKHLDLTVKWGHMMNKEDIASLVKGHHTVIGVNEPSPINPNEHIKAVGSVIEGAKKAGIGKILIIGHPVYRPIENTMEFYDSWKSVALAQREALKLFQRESYLNWGYVYSSSLEPDKRTGRIDKQENMILATPAGETLVPIKNFAPVLFDTAIMRVVPTKMELELNI